MEETTTEEKSGYGKRPLWQWIVMYLVIAVVVYGAIYYLFLHKQNSYSTQAQSAPKTTVMQNSVYKMMPKGKLGTVLTDPKGMTLYTYAQDTTDMSNCIGACLKAWPAYVARSDTNLPANITVIKRSDGTMQFAWKGMPLYYFSKDGDSGDAYGNGIGGVWSVIK